MRKYYIVLFLISFQYYSVAEDLGAYCFNFTWLGNVNRTPNCTLLKEIPCEEQFSCEDPPLDVVYSNLWNNFTKSRNETITIPNTCETANVTENDVKKYFCKLRPGYFCIKYTYIYNNAIVNITHFCGKTSDAQAACYTHPGESHVVEVCACQTGNNEVPCNKSIKQEYSIVIIFISILFFLFIIDVNTNLPHK